MPNHYVQEQIIQAQDADFSNKQAEEAVLGYFLLGKRDAADYAATLTTEDFYYADHGKIFSGVKAVLAKRQKADLITIDAALTAMYPLEMPALSEIMIRCSNANMQFTISTHSIADYCQIVKDLSARRQSIRTFEGLTAQFRDPTRDIADILEQLRLAAGRIASGKHKWHSMSDVLLATYDYLEKRQQGQIKAITTGVNNIDALIGGFFGGELTIIGARPSVGKSAFGANIALSAARKGFKVAILSREMSDVQYGSRIISHEAWIDGMKLRKGDIDPDDWTRIAERLGELGALPIDFLFTVRTIEDLCQEVRRKVENGQLDMLIVDYLQLMQSQRRFDKDYLRVGYISAELKHLAMDCGIPVIALAQVGRDAEGSMPSLKNLRDSGNIEQDADGVIFLHRAENANDEYIDKRDRPYFDDYKERGLTYLCIGVAKQRQGATGKACVLFDPTLMRYIEIDRTERSENHGTETR